MLGFFVLFSATSVSALTISVDMDAGTPGIQSNVIVNLGDILNVDIVITGDGVTTFDTTILDLAFNDAGSVLTLNWGPIAGGLAARAPVTAIDVFGGITGVVPGDHLTPLGAAPPPSFANNLGVIGLASGGLPFNTIAAGAMVSLANLEFQVTSLGSSTLGLAASPLLDPALAQVAAPVAHTFVAGSVTPIPEPTAAVVFGAGLALVGFALRHSGQRRLYPRV